MQTDQTNMPDIIKVHFFDMDHTLADNDCDLSWKEFLVEHKLAGYLDRWHGKRFYRQYRKGTLDQDKFLKFQLQQFIGKTPADMETLLNNHFREKVAPRLYQQAVELIHRLQGEQKPVVLVTATNEAIAKPLQLHLNLDGLLGTKLELIKGKYSGRIIHPYCIGAHKLAHMRNWLQENIPGTDLSECAYWGDSDTDIPIMEEIGFPFAVNPAPGLAAKAAAAGWPVVEFRKLMSGSAESCPR